MKIKNYFCICVCLFSSLVWITACKNLDRDNILDPKNPASTRESIILAEAFVNQTTGLAASEYSDYALEALDSLQQFYVNRLVYIEYHRDIPGYDDHYGTIPLLEEYYTNYVTSETNRFKGVPDIFVNGAAQHVQGASSVHNVIKRVQGIAIDMIDQPAEYTIEAEINSDNPHLTGKYRVARLGDESAPKMKMRIVLTKSYGGNNKRVATKISIPDNISEIDAGEYAENSFDLDVSSVSFDRAIFILTDAQGLNVFNVLEKKL